MLEMWRSAACYMLLRLSKKMKFQSNNMFLLNPDNQNPCRAKILHLLEMKQRDRFTIDNRTRAGVCFHAPSYQIRDSIKYFIKQNQISELFCFHRATSAQPPFKIINKYFPPCKLWSIGTAAVLRCW